MRKIHFAIALFALSGIVSLAEGQAPTPKSQTFEAAMFRLEDPNNKIDYNRPDAPNQNQKFPSNRFIQFHTGLKSLISDAYGIAYGNILGGPAWLESQHYDLSAKVEGNALLTKEQMRPMLRNLLEERVHLAVHVEHRIVPGYELLIAKGGSKLKANTGAPYMGTSNNFQFKFQNAPMEQLVILVSYHVGRPVIDKTGLTGIFDYDLKFAPDTADNPAYSGFPTIFTALEKNLGLKLVPQQVPQDYLIIDHVERSPTAN